MLHLQTIFLGAPQVCPGLSGVGITPAFERPIVAPRNSVTAPQICAQEQGPVAHDHDELPLVAGFRSRNFSINLRRS
jgi:hypothetical protein